MTLTTAQKATIKAYILANFADQVTNGDYEGIANALNADAAPDFWTWKSSISRSEIVTGVSVDGTTFNWTALIARTQGERDGWREMLAPGSVNPSLANVRQGFADIFSGNTNSAPAQRAHLLAIARRKARLVEKLLASGTGSTADPAVLGAEGTLNVFDIGPILA